MTSTTETVMLPPSARLTTSFAITIITITILIITLIIIIIIIITILVIVITVIITTIIIVVITTTTIIREGGEGTAGEGALLLLAFVIAGVPLDLLVEPPELEHLPHHCALRLGDAALGVYLEVFLLLVPLAVLGADALDGVDDGPHEGLLRDLHIHPTTGHLRGEGR